MKKIMLLSCAFFSTGISLVKAQQATTATGGQASGTGGSSSYSIGQIAYSTHMGSNGSVTQGVQQPYEIFTVLGLDVSDIQIELQTYPNPTTDFLTIRVESQVLNELSYQLFDANGKLIENKKMNSSLETINLENLANATYFLKILSADKELKIVKIIKN